MKNKLKKISSIGAMVSVFFIAIIIVSSLFGPSEEKITLDLDNFSISTITEEEKIKIVNSSKSYLSSEKRIGKSSGIRDYTYEEYDGDKTEFSAESFCGLRTVNATLVKDCTLHFNIASSSSGEAKIFIIIEDTVADEFDFSEKKQLSYEIEGEKRVYVKIAAQNVKVEISVERSFS